MKKAFLFLFGLVIYQYGIAQLDIHFSQFFNSSVALNPAEAGMDDSDVRVLANYRTQWTSVNSPFKTKALSIDAGLMEQKLKTEYMGIGLDFFQDQSDETYIKSFGVSSSFSYVTMIDRQSKLSFGLKVGFLQRSIDFSGLIWANQFEGEDFNLIIPPNITYGADKVSAADLGVGVFYKINPMKGKIFYAGLAADHLNAPNLAFVGKEDKYLRKYTMKLGANIGKRNTNVSFLPSVISMLQGKNHYTIFGSDVKYVISSGSRSTGINKTVAFTAGGFYRLSDAFYAHVGFSFGDYALSASYDITLSELTLAAGPTGALEVMFIYTPAITDFAKKKRTYSRH